MDPADLLFASGASDVSALQEDMPQEDMPQEDMPQEDILRTQQGS